MKNQLNHTSRREFIKKSSLVAAGIPFAGTLACASGKVLGANDTINVGIVGIHSRGGALLKTLTSMDKVNVVAICDVDEKDLGKRIAEVKAAKGKAPKGEKDFRKMVENPDIDAIFIASADHTHAPFSILALQNGKHVYCEKPCSHNPAEGDMLIAAQQKYGKLVQIGNQQRSAPSSQEAIKDIADGLIGEVYAAKAWYANNRGSIGNGKNVAVPAHLNWDLWQGPAPRTDYKDNIVHYNWHWFWRWGTGEINNNGLHEMDICRWALGVKNPTKVTSVGGRFHYTNDDWEFYDTQFAHYEFEGGKTLTWEGRSCNNQKLYNRGRGAMVYGTKGSMMLDRNDYYAYDLKGKEIKHVPEKAPSETTNIVGAGALTYYHIQNFFAGIREGEKLNSPIEIANVSNHLCHLGNISQKLGTSLHIDAGSGKIKENSKAMKMWGREYAAGWEVTV